MAILGSSARQVQILELAAQGQSDKEIAIALGISVHTVRSHLQRLYRTHGFTNRAEAVAMFASPDTLATAAPPDPDFEERLAALVEAAGVPYRVYRAHTQRLLSALDGS